jgi:hypothetical protein
MQLLRLRNTCFALCSLFLFSCAAKKAPERLTVVAPEDFSGVIKITTCDNHAVSDNILLDSSGRGRTSICSSSADLTLRLVRGQQSVDVPAITSRSGDGFVVNISAKVEPLPPAHR